MRVRHWLNRGIVIYRWPVPLIALYGTLAWINPKPYLVTELNGEMQHFLYAFAALAAALATVWPKRLLYRDALALGSTLACGWRAATLVVNPGRYTPAEVVAYATVWVVIGCLVVQMLVLTWPTVMMDKRGKVPRDPARV